MLPKVVSQTSSVDVQGTDIPIRALTRSEHMHVGKLINENKISDGEIYCLSKGTDTPLAEAKEWYENTDSDEVKKVLDAIGVLTGVDPEDSKSTS